MTVKSRMLNDGQIAGLNRKQAHATTRRCGESLGVRGRNVAIEYPDGMGE